MVKQYNSINGDNTRSTASVTENSVGTGNHSDVFRDWMVCGTPPGRGTLSLLWLECGKKGVVIALPNWKCEVFWTMIFLWTLVRLWTPYLCPGTAKDSRNVVLVLRFCLVHEVAFLQYYCKQNSITLSIHYCPASASGKMGSTLFVHFLLVYVLHIIQSFCLFPPFWGIICRSRELYISWKVRKICCYSYYFPLI